MSSESDEDRSPNQIRGRPFAPGNPGRPPGAKNKTTQLAAGLLAEAAPEIMRVVVERAKTGDPAICKIVLPHLLPKQRAVELELPQLNGTADTPALIAAIINAVGNGQIAPSDGASLIGAVEAYVRVKNVDDLESRVEALEKNLRAT
jgi:hypothetical protein